MRCWGLARRNCEECSGRACKQRGGVSDARWRRNRQTRREQRRLKISSAFERLRVRALRVAVCVCVCACVCVQLPLMSIVER